MARTPAFHVGNTGSIPVSFSILVMGALTSKPYAFSARPWELRTVYSLDFLDGIASKIRIDLRGVDVMRILPVVFDQISEEWITDKIRFSYDAFRRQRLMQVLVKVSKDKFYAVSLREAFAKFFGTAKSIDFASVFIVAGKAQDIETLFSSKVWGRSWFYQTNLLQDSLENNYINTFFRLKNTFFLPLPDTCLKAVDYVFLLGTNLRYESPLLNLRIKQYSKQSEPLIFSFGAFTKNTFSFFNLGANLSNLALFFKGKLKISAFTAKKRGIIFFGNSFSTFHNFFYSVFQFNTIEKPQMVYVSAFSSLLNMFATNFTSMNSGLVEIKNKAIIFNLQADDFSVENISGTHIFFGSHGSKHSENADYIFPSAHFFEKKFNLLNFLGISEQAQQAVVPTGNARSEISYFYALDKFFYLSSINERFRLLMGIERTESSIYYLSLFFGLKGFFYKPILYYIKNRWKNFYNPHFGRLLTYNKSAKFSAFFKTKKLIGKWDNCLVNRYINNYMFTHTFTKASHFLAVANTRYSNTSYNFNYD
jgi:NADH dehydrogenase (ubiquinone) Fe-S protein 1